MLVAHVASYMVVQTQIDQSVHFAEQLAVDIAATSSYHQQLYLHPFQDARLANYWTFNQLDEVKFFPSTAIGDNVMMHDNSTLWVSVSLLLQHTGRLLAT